MIIGKSLTALGGGGLKPEIIVTAKAGALLNLHYKDSSIILQSYQLSSLETQHTFVVSVSETAYVVEDVTNSASVEVLVDAVAVFDVEISYRLYLYKDGDECESITGGWTTNGYSRNSYTIRAGSKESNALNIASATAAPTLTSTMFGTQNAIDLSNFSKVYLECLVGNANQYNPKFICCSSKKLYDSSAITEEIYGNTVFPKGERIVLKMNIKEGIQFGYVVWLSDNMTEAQRAYRIWLE